MRLREGRPRGRPARLLWTATALLALALPAQAAGHGHRSLSTTVAYEAAPAPGGGATIAFQCAAQATPPASAVRITCGSPAVSQTLPGAVALVAGTGSVASLPFSFCWSASATYAPGDVLTTSDCTFGSSLVAVDGSSTGG